MDLKAVYLFSLAVIIGIELSIGVFLAPVLFTANEILKEAVLTRLQSGLLMSEIFIKFNYVLLFVSSLSFLYESYSFFKDELAFKLRFSKFMLSFIVLALSLLFVFHLSAYILEAARAAMQNVDLIAFEKVHKASELSLKIIIIAQFLLFFLSFNIARK